MTEEASSGETVEVDKVLAQLIDTMFRERKVATAFENYFQTSALSSKEKEAIEDLGIENPIDLSNFRDTKTAARVFAVARNYEYQAAPLMLGTSPLSSGDVNRKNFYRAKEAIEQERERVLNKRKISKDEFYKLLGQVTHGSPDEQSLTTLELINADVDSFIEQKIDKTVYDQNITTMKKGRVLTKRTSNNQTFYEAQFKPIFRVVFVNKGQGLKVISFGDLL
ncbi:MAG TPA: hypothetical protein VKB86_09355 [Pyrinomonadaceae bacterium]|nr:hypothetical protein [Pyrinomonadaceae bacterium]